MLIILKGLQSVGSSHGNSAHTKVAFKSSAVKEEGGGAGGGGSAESP